MKRNQWYGRRFSQWIELNLRKKFGDDWMLDNPPANFEVLQKFAEQQKYKCSEAEYIIANKLREYGLPIEHQQIYLNRYIADLCLHDARTIIEIDDISHTHPYRIEKDGIRDQAFIAFGFDVHRWKTKMSPDEWHQKITCFVKAYKRHSKGYRLRPLVRPHSIEKITPNGLVQKALNLKKRMK